MRKQLALLCAASILSACQSGQKQSPKPMPLPAPPISATIPCKPLPPMFTTAGEAVAWVDTVAGLYVECDGKRRVAVEAWPH